jgi:hypothetical protein
MVGVLEVKDPAVIAALGHCWMARWRGLGAGMIESRHPRECGWCEYPAELLLSAIRAFDFEGFEARRFSGRPYPEQVALVLAAQAFTPEQPIPPTRESVSVSVSTTTTTPEVQGIEEITW